MKKSPLNFLIIVLVLMSFNSCKSSKKGCGLTSDAQKIEQSTSNKAIVIAEV